MTDAIRATRASLWLFAAHYRHKPLQAGAILLGIILAVTLLTGVKATNENAINSYSQASELLSRQASGYILPPSGFATMDEHQYFRLRQAGIPALAVLEGVVMNSHKQRLAVTGSDLVAASAWGRDHPGGDSPLVDLPLAALLAGEPIVLMSRTQAAQLAPDGQMQLGRYQVQVVTLPDSRQLGNQLLTDISFAQQLLNKPGRISYVALMRESDVENPQLSQLLQDNNNLQREDGGSSLTKLTASFHLNLQAMAMLAFLVGLFIAYNGIRYSLMKRQRLMLKVLQLGVSRKALMAALIIELVLLVHLGSAIGFVLGLQLSQWLQPMVAMTLEQLYGARLLPGQWQLSWLMEAIALTLATALGACIPLYRSLTRQSLAQSGQLLTQNLLHYRSHQLQFTLAIILLLISTLGFSLSQDYRISLALLALLTLAIPLLLPQLIRWSLNLLTKLTPPGLGRYMVAETKELTAPLALAMMAILLALSATIAMNTLVGSFEHTLKNWLDNRLHGDLYIRPRPVDVSHVAALLADDADITAIHYQWEAFSDFAPPSQMVKTPITDNHSGDAIDEQAIVNNDIKSKIQPPMTQTIATPAVNSSAITEQVLLLSRDTQAVYDTLAIKQATSGAMTDFLAGNSAFISEPLAMRHQLQLGDRIWVRALASVFPHGIRILGIYHDYGKPMGEVLIAHNLWLQAGLSDDSRNFAVNYRKDIAVLEQRLQQAGLSPAIMYRQQKIKQQAFIMFNRTFAITGVLSSLTLTVAAIGLFSACIMLMQTRQAPLARLYALGVSRPRLMTLVSSQMLLLVLLTTLLALPAGALLGWLLIHKVTLQAFGWSLQLVWDWQVFFHAMLLALTACALAVAIPLYRQIRRPLISSLQQETL